MDFNNIVYNSRVENVTIQKDIFVKKVALKVPEGIPMGRYVFYSKIIYEDKIAVSSDTFQLETVSVVMWIIVLILIGILILLIIFAIFFIKKRRKDEARRKREEEEKKALKLSKLSLNLPKTI
jgi:LPXTG-motif cell wall-anchored protein